MNGQYYVDNLRVQLDRVSDENEIIRQLRNAIEELREQGYTNEEIKSFFQQEFALEAQDSTNMIQNHLKYREMIAKILGDKKS
ncbi:hypothetical protein SAMN04487884_10712 [Butyrivibrio fibrisolvens]|uniref:Uncharacterized protein n=1 Tax=Butyrivibrio fibrisolvens TaxID=831 RepID=A0A1H9Q1V5_BUTFI|nr:hypothetical protein [Butyrivibrio fibrisolvens]SER54362.1 hypothetical protein SAMN04487884_10712 [Butyrivibrio fibrisolvens]